MFLNFAVETSDMIHAWLRTLILFLGCLFVMQTTHGADVPIPPATPLERDFAFLGKIDVEPTPVAVLEYARTYIPKNLTRQQAEAFTLQLGSNDFHEREDASQSLVQSPNFPDDVLNGAANSDDLEIRWRARLVLSQRGRRDWRYFQAALRILAEKPPPETLEVLLELSAYYMDESNLNLIQRVLASISREEDVAKLIAVEDKAPAGKRFAAAMALRAFRPEGKPRSVSETHDGTSTEHCITRGQAVGKRW